MSRSTLDTAIRGACAAAPRECCGVLLGRAGQILWAEPLANVAPDEDRFEADALELLALEERAAAAGRRVLGYYHSHPAGDVAPSALDRAGQVWPELPPFYHLIVSPAGGWRMYDTRGGAWRPVDVELLDAAGGR